MVLLSQEPLSPECRLPISDNDADEGHNSHDGEVDENDNDGDGGNGNGDDDDDEQQKNSVPHGDNDQQNNLIPIPELSAQMLPSLNHDKETLPTGLLKPSQGLEEHPSRVPRSNSPTAHNGTQPNGDK